MPRLLVSLLVLLFGLAATGQAATARDGFARGSGFKGPSGFKGAFSRGGFAHGKRFHGLRRFRTAVPLFLDEGVSDGVFVVVNQTFVPSASAPAAFSVPTLADLPVSVGIREAPPAQAAIYVLNENGAVRREAAVGRVQVASGPKILEMRPEAEPSAAPVETTSAVEKPFGARIIHLAVPVARAD